MNIFSYYSFFSNIVWSFFDLLLPFVRKLIFKIIFKSFGQNSYVDYTSYCRYTRKISIGNNVSINRGCKFFASYHIKDSYIIIKDNVALGPNVTIFGAGHNYNELSLPDTSETVLIQNNVWVGGNVTILQGVTIGEGAVIAAGSVVTRDVEPFTVVAGVPAKIINHRIITNEN